MVSKRAKRWLTRGATLLVVIGILALFVATWLQAGTVVGEWLDASSTASNATAIVQAVGVDELVLRDDGAAAVPGTWGLAFDGGRAIVGAVVTRGSGEVHRQLIEISGGLTPGTEVRFDVNVWGSAAIEGLGFTEVEVPGDDDAVLPAWFAPGVDDTWVVFVHGNGADRGQALRAAQSVSAAGYPSLVISYRNDDGAPASSSGRHGYGFDEWRDLQAAVAYALGSGALDFVMVGYGSGGSVLGTYLYQSAGADRVVGVVLDAPMLSLDTAISDSWSRQGVPGWTIDWTKAIASMRFGLDLGALDHVARAAEWKVPVLVLHGRDDRRNPLEASESFVIARGDSALLLTFPEAGPGASWNVDPDRYEQAVAGFVDSVAAAKSSFEPVDP